MIKHIVLLATAVLGPLAAASAEEVELLANPQVSTSSEPWRTWPRKGQPTFGYDTSTGHGDSTSLRVTALAKDTDGSWLQKVTCEHGTPYTAAFWFRTDPPSGVVSLLIEFYSPKDYVGQVRREVTANGAEWTRHEETFIAPPRATEQAFEVWVNLNNVWEGTAWFDDFSFVKTTRPVVQFCLDEPPFHILRPGEAPLRGRFLQKNRSARAARYILELRRGTQILESASGELGKEVAVVLSAEKLLQEGAYTLAAHVECAGETVYQSEDVLICRSRPPKVAIGAHRELLVGGKPFFPIGVYYARLGDLEGLPGNGFNCVQRLERRGLPSKGARAFFAEAQRVGLRVLLETSGRLLNSSDLEPIKAHVEFFREEPALLCYYPLDEPSRCNVDVAHLQLVYNLIKSLDPDHPQMVVHANPALLDTYAPASDIIAVDPYKPPDVVQSWVTQANAASRGRKPTWVVIGSFPWSKAKGLPTPEYVRSAVYVSLISGAKGLLYFTYYFGNQTLKQSVLWEPIGRLNREVTELAPWLLACEPDPVKASDERMVAAVFRGKDGAILLAANTSENDAVEARVALPGVKGEAQALFSDGRISCDQGVDLKLAPYGTIALRLPGP